MVPPVLYHFTCIDSVRGVEREGITMGAVPVMGLRGMRLRTGWTWLTEDGDPAAQSWVRRRDEGAKCDRKEFRFTVDPSRCDRLTRWLDHPLRREFRAEALADFELYPEVVAKWWLARCPVPKDALIRLDRFATTEIVS